MMLSLRSNIEQPEKYNSKEEKILGQAMAVEKTCTWTV